MADRDVARGEVAVQLVDVPVDLEPVRGSAPVHPRAGDDDHPQLGQAALAAAARWSSAVHTPEPPAETMHTRSSGA